MKTKEDRACTPGADASKAINRVAKDISKSKSVKVAASAKLHPFDVAIGQNDATCSKEMESDPGILTGSVIMEELTPFIISNKDKLHLWTPMTFFASIIKWCKAQPLKEWQLLVCTEDSVKTAETTAVINKIAEDFLDNHGVYLTYTHKSSLARRIKQFIYKKEVREIIGSLLIKLFEARHGPHEQKTLLADLGSDIPVLYKNHKQLDKSGAWAKQLVLSEEDKVSGFKLALTSSDPKRFCITDERTDISVEDVEQPLKIRLKVALSLQSRLASSCELLSKTLQNEKAKYEDAKVSVEQLRNELALADRKLNFSMDVHELIPDSSDLVLFLRLLSNVSEETPDLDSLSSDVDVVLKYATTYIADLYKL